MILCGLSSACHDSHAKAHILQLCTHSVHSPGYGITPHWFASAQYAMILILKVCHRCFKQSRACLSLACRHLSPIRRSRSQSPDAPTAHARKAQAGAAAGDQPCLRRSSDQEKVDALWNAFQNDFSRRAGAATTSGLKGQRCAFPRAKLHASHKHAGPEEADALCSSYLPAYRSSSPGVMPHSDCHIAMAIL